MEFTKEQIDYLKEYFATYSGDEFVTYDEILNSFLEPKKKRIMFEFEYPESESHRMNAKSLTLLLCPTNEYISPTVKVKELPEVFTRKEILEMFDCLLFKETINECCDELISERESK